MLSNPGRLPQCGGLAFFIHTEALQISMQQAADIFQTRKLTQQPENHRKLCVGIVILVTNKVKLIAFITHMTLVKLWLDNIGC